MSNNLFIDNPQELLKDAILLGIGPLSPPSQKGFMCRNCMLCSERGHSRDTKRRFGLKFETDGTVVTHCFNCAFSAVWKPGTRISKNFKIFLYSINVSDDVINRINFSSCFADYGGNYESAKKALFHGWTKTEMVKDAMPLSFWIDEECDDDDFLTVLEYACDRKILDFDNFYWTPDREVLNHKRLFHPFYHNDNLVGYTGRYCFKPNKKIPKYINVMPDDFIYNLDAQRISNRDKVILIEGVFDAWAIDGISPLNNALNSRKVEIINSLRKEVIVVPDLDKDGELFVETALENDWYVSIPDWGENIKDAAQAASVYGRIQTLKHILRCAESNAVKINVAWKLRQKRKHEKK